MAIGTDEVIVINGPAVSGRQPGGGVAEIDRHMSEIGHAIESVSATGGGTHILARCVLHFN